MTGAKTRMTTFEELFFLEYGRVANVALRILGDRAAAEDIAQEAFAAFSRRGVAIDEGSRGWLCVAAAHGALNEVRSRRRRDSRELNVVRLDARGSEIDPSEVVAREEQRALVRAAMERIPERAASLLALRYSGLTYREIASALGIDEPQIGVLLERARRAFRKEFEDDHA